MAKLTDEQQYIRMTETPVSRLVTSLAVPTVAGMLVSSIYNITDTFFVSQLGTSASAAVGVVFSIQSLIQAVGFSIAMGSGSMVSRRLGQKDNEGACRFVSSAFLMAFVCGALLGLLGLVFLEPVMRVLGSTETMLPYSCAYARYILATAPIFAASFVLNVAMKSQGRATLSMLGMMAGNLLNVVLDPLFIFTFDMGTSGAALATAVSQCVSFLALLWCFLKKQDTLHIRWKFVSRNAHDYVTIVRVGSPTLCRQGCGSIASALLNNRAKAFGDAAVAAMSIANRVYNVVRSILVGIGQGFQPVAGFNYGAKKPQRVKDAFRFTVVLGSGVAVLATVVLALSAPQLMAIFRRDDPEVIRMGSQALRMLCVVLPLLGYSTYVNQMLQCLGRSGQATFLASCRQGTLYVPLILVLPAILGLTGIQLTQPIADGLTFLVSIPFHIWFFRSPKGLKQCEKG
ncbi:MAG: MATE family efflux transporter [Clostridia bacterium]|nr:MATE family efflux transporter [Clostridia bacterium]